MKGSVRKRGSAWSYRIDVGVVDGRRKQMERGGFKTKGAAQVALTSALNELNLTGRVIEDQKITFQQVFENFIANEAPITRKPTTIRRYNSLYNNHFREALGHMWMPNIGADTLQEFIMGKTTTHSDEYVRGMYNLLLVLFGYAERMEYIKDNIIGNVMPPKQETSKDEVKVFTKEELKTLFDRIASTNLQPAFILGINLGVRAGECYALRWSDFDLENKTVKIDKQLQNYHKKWSFTTLKTKNSYRTLTFGDNLKNYLLDLKEKQEQGRLFYDDYFKVNTVMDYRSKNKKLIKVLQIDDFVNIKPNGEMLNTHSHKVISRIAKSEFNMDFKFHKLRHTHATILLEQGLNPKYIQERLGHSKLEFTLRLYTHITRNMEVEATKVLDDQLDF